MPDQEVLINDSNLNAIANAIRRKNGLVRTYKPREMAPAIRAINADAPDSREYTVTVIQTPHQTIKVRQVLGGEKQYDQSFTVSEPYWKIQATIEADAGYVAGGLNYPDEVTVDRDITIKATPATEIEVPPDIYITLYIAGYGTWQQTRHTSDEQMTNYNQNIPPEVSNLANKPQGKVVYHFIDAYGRKWGQSTAYRDCLFGGYGGAEPTTVNATDITFEDLHLNGCTDLNSIVRGSRLGVWLENIDISSFNISDVERIGELFPNSLRDLRTIGNISYWDTSSLRELGVILYPSKYIDSLDLSGWTTPELRSVGKIFPNGRILDISNWDTSKISSFNLGIRPRTEVGVLYPAYLIMDKEEVKFSGNYIFGNIANCKYLVPESMVDAYKQHPNWASRASQIESITNYTINRGDGQIEVVPNW